MSRSAPGSDAHWISFSGHSIRRSMPSTSETWGRTSWKS